MKERLLSSQNKTEATTSAIAEIDKYIERAEKIKKISGSGESTFTPKLGKDTGEYDPALLRATDKRGYSS